MRSLLDLRLSRLALALVVAASAVATALILLGGSDRTPAQLAALAALHERSAAVHAPRTVTASPSAGGGSGGSGGGTSGGGAAGGSASHRQTTHPAPSAAAPSAPAATTPAPATPAPVAPSTPTTPASTPTTSTTQTSTTSSPAAESNLPKVGHVFEITLSAAGYNAAFGSHSQLPYLRSLRAKGTLLSDYRSLGSGELADELALVSGQAPNPDTARGCPTYEDFPESAVANKAGLVSGRGCVYPETALTIGDQVTASGKVWHAYVADMGSESCVHPNSDAADNIALPFSKPGYDTRHNPFIYFHSLLDLGDCSSDDVDLSHLPKALHSAKATPRFVYLAADACADGDPTMIPADPTTTTTSTTSTSTTPTTSTTATTSSPSAASTTSTTSTTAPVTSTTTPVTSTSTPVTSTSTPVTSTTTTSTTSTTTPATSPSGCPSKAPAGLVAENAFLKQWIPHILASPAYRKDGVLLITVASSGQARGHSARTGALVLSRWARRGRTLSDAAGPYSLLRFTEDVLGFTRLAHAVSAPALAPQLLTTSH